MLNERLEELLVRDRTQAGDSERKAMFTIFSGNDDLYSKINYLYDFEERGIRLDCFSSVDLSSSAYQLVRLAFNLYSSANEANVCDVFSSLDNDNYNLAMRAINIRFNRAS